LGHEQFIEMPDGEWLSLEVGLQVIPAARVRLVSIGEPPPTLGAPPERPRWIGRFNTHRILPVPVHTKTATTAKDIAEDLRKVLASGTPKTKSKRVDRARVCDAILH
jgi:hypothetical protein